MIRSSNGNWNKSIDIILNYPRAGMSKSSLHSRYYWEGLRSNNKVSFLLFEAENSSTLSIHKTNIRCMCMLTLKLLDYIYEIHATTKVATGNIVHPNATAILTKPHHGGPVSILSTNFVLNSPKFTSGILSSNSQNATKHFASQSLQIIS